MRVVWKSVVALAVAGAFVAGPAWAQTSTPATADKSADKSATGATGTAGSTGAADKPDKAAKSGEMKVGKGESAIKGGANQEQVRMAQQALKDKGHDPGPIDGKFGPKTKAALTGFQKAQGLKESGQLDSETMAKLEMKTGALPGSSPSASPATDTKSDASKSDVTKPAQAPKPADAAKPAQEKKQ